MKCCTHLRHPQLGLLVIERRRLRRLFPKRMLMHDWLDERTLSRRPLGQGTTQRTPGWIGDLLSRPVGDCVVIGTGQRVGRRADVSSCWTDFGPRPWYIQFGMPAGPPDALRSGCSGSFYLIVVWNRQVVSFVDRSAGTGWAYFSFLQGCR